MSAEKSDNQFMPSAQTLYIGHICKLKKQKKNKRQMIKEEGKKHKENKGSVAMNGSIK